jgi:hypothetical protein
MTEYPECEKMLSVQEKSQAIGEFLEWLQSGEADNTKFKRVIFLGARRIVSEHNDGKPMEDEDDWYVSDHFVDPIHYNIEELLAKFFGIDLAKVEEEKRAMLEEARNSR